MFPSTIRGLRIKTLLPGCRTREQTILGNGLVIDYHRDRIFNSMMRDWIIASDIILSSYPRMKGIW